MNWDAVGAIAELIGAVGVVISLIYLALQIRHNSTSLEQNTAISRANAAVLSANYGADFVRSTAMDSELARIWTWGFSRLGDLDDDEVARFDALLISQLIHIDVNYFLMRNGTLDPEVYAIWDRVLTDWTRHPRFRAMWESGRISHITTATFGTLIREILGRRQDA